jgi:hypothetical protein
MFSIENFYYTLYHHLLKPLDLRDGMFTKFGSSDFEDFCVSRYATSSFKDGFCPPKENYCFYFDQEPLHCYNFNETLFGYGTSLRCRILANSEVSDLKKRICQENNYQDWYYFFHGFAALDWFRDSKYFCQNIEWNKPYISLNRLNVNDRSYRLNLVARLAEQKLLHQGHVSLHLDQTEYSCWRHELDSTDTKLSIASCQLIKKHLNYPLTLDKVDSTGSMSANFGHGEFELWKSGLWHLVTETIFYYNKLHLTEKIFKPIVSQRPFMLAAAPGNLAYLKSYGFRTFDKWIDESYDKIQDHDCRLQAIVDQTQRICAMSQRELRQMHQDMQSVLLHNFNHFFTDFKHQIVNELVDNFECVVKLWNQGRVDGKELSLQNINFEHVKKMLYQ